MSSADRSSPDVWNLYRRMLLSRRFEDLVRRYWERGAISGEMHLSTGEEAIAVGIVDHLRQGDAMALDHRGTAPLVARGVDLVSLLRELLGRPDGLCAGQGGHMHLFAKELAAASSGIVGAAGPLATGFALANDMLRQGAIAVAFFGDGAMNQGMLLESFNLAATWKLPVLFVCKDDGWAVTTRSSSVTAGNLVERARGFGLNATEADGLDALAVWDVAREAVERARAGAGPSFIRARCVHLDGHFLGDPLLQLARHPLQAGGDRTRTLFDAATSATGANIGERFSALGKTAAAVARFAVEHSPKQDPIERMRGRLADDERARIVAARVDDEIALVERMVSEPFAAAVAARRGTEEARQ